ncbi:MAG: HNH endonuclease [Actinobacteria bacterium]|nr:HNH endonuclease [Actinomycetota bacterium]
MGYKYIGGRCAHRVIYERHHGPIPAGWVVHHRDGDPGNNDIAKRYIHGKRDIT